MFRLLYKGVIDRLRGKIQRSMEFLGHKTYLFKANKGGVSIIQLEKEEIPFILTAYKSNATDKHVWRDKDMLKLKTEEEEEPKEIALRQIAIATQAERDGKTYRSILYMPAIGKHHMGNKLFLRSSEFRFVEGSDDFYLTQYNYSVDKEILDHLLLIERNDRYEEMSRIYRGFKYIVSSLTIIFLLRALSWGYIKGVLENADYLIDESEESIPVDVFNVLDDKYLELAGGSAIEDYLKYVEEVKGVVVWQKQN